MSKIDIDKLVAFEYKRQLQFTPSNAKNYLLMAFDKALKEQGLCYKDGEIIEIESKPANSFQISKDLQEWSEEDEKMFLETMHDYDAVEDEWGVERASAKEWLKSLKGRVQPQPKQERSEVDEAVLDALIRRLEGEDIYVSPHLAAECLKSIKERIKKGE